MLLPNLIAATGLLCFSILGAGSQSTPPSEEGPATAGPVAVTLRSDKKIYGVKDAVKLTFVVKNPSKIPVKLTFSSGMKYDFEIRRGKTPSGEKVWQWAKGQMFAQMFLFSTLEAGKSMKFVEKFVPGEMRGDGKPSPELSPGTYTATAILELSGRAPRPMARTTFTVK